MELEELLTGPTAIAFITEKPDGSPGDAVDVAKALRDFAKTNPSLVVKGGVLGTKPLTADEAKALAEVEPREVLLAKLAGALAAPMVQLAGLLEALPRNFAYGLQGPHRPAGRRAGGSAGRRACCRTRSRPRPPRPTPTTDEPPTEEAPTEEPDRRGRHHRRPPVAEEAPAEEPRRRHHHGGVSTMPTKEDILDSIANMTVLELSELLKDFEEKFGVTAAAPVAVAAAAPAAVAVARPRPRRRRTSSTSSSPRPATRRSRSSRRCAR